MFPNTILIPTTSICVFVYIIDLNDESVTKKNGEGISNVEKTRTFLSGIECQRWAGQSLGDDISRASLGH